MRFPYLNAKIIQDFLMLGWETSGSDGGSSTLVVHTKSGNLQFLISPILSVLSHGTCGKAVSYLATGGKITSCVFETCLQRLSLFH